MHYCGALHCIIILLTFRYCTPQKSMTWVRPKLHYTDTDYGHVAQHHQRTSSQQFYNLLYNKFATSQCQSPTSRHVKMLGCGKFLTVGGEFVVQQVVELLWTRPLMVSVAGVRVVEFGTKSVAKTLWAEMSGNVTQFPESCHPDKKWRQPCWDVWPHTFNCIVRCCVRSVCIASFSSFKLIHRLLI